MTACRDQRLPNSPFTYLSDFGIIICRVCKYAIQPQAIGKHLLKHRIYRDDRGKLLEQITNLSLRAPEDTPLPVPGSPAIPDLPIYRGLKCLMPGCSKICISTKRMLRHWRLSHGQHDSKNVNTRVVSLQTFFRGNKVRYFEVEGVPQPLDETKGVSLSSTRLPAENTHPTSRNAAFAPTTCAFEDLRSVQYFHHYMSTPCLRPQRGENGSLQFWAETIPQEAFKYNFLLYAILSTGAIHLAVQASDQESIRAHHDNSIRYQSLGIAGFQEALKGADQSNSTALIASSRFQCIHYFASRQLNTSNESGRFNSPAQASSFRQLSETLLKLRECTSLSLSLQHTLPPGSGFIFTEDVRCNLRDIYDSESMESDMRASLHAPEPYLERVRCLAENTALLSSVQTDSGRSALIRTVVALMPCIARSYASPDVSAVWNGIETWASTVSEQFLDLLDAGHPAAMTIFAHFCPLLRKLEASHWYIVGQSERFLGVVRAALSPEWACMTSGLEEIG